MEIIEKMENKEFEDICDTGHDLLHVVMKFLQERGTALDQAASVFAVAAAGIATSTGFSVPEFSNIMDISLNLWKVETVNGIDNVVYSPPKRAKMQAVIVEDSCADSDEN